MSQGSDRSCIRCDGDRCERIARLPIGLRSLLRTSVDLPPAADWLFVTGADSSRHYCPDCAQRLLRNEETITP